MTDEEAIKENERIDKEFEKKLDKFNKHVWKTSMMQDDVKAYLYNASLDND